MNLLYMRVLIGQTRTISVLEGLSPLFIKLIPFDKMNKIISIIIAASLVHF